MRVGIAGTGGVGGILGGFLARAGAEVALLARGAHRDALRERGLRFEGTLGDFSVDDFDVSDNGSELGGCDVVFVSGKTFHLGELIPHLRAMVHDKTVVVPLQNGISTWDVLGRELREEQVVGGIIYVNSWVDSPGVIKQIGSFVRVVMGEREGGSSKRLERIRDLLVAAKVSVELEKNILRRNWEKFLGFEPMALVGALSRSAIGTFRADAGARAVLLALMEEVAAIAKRKGVSLPEDAVARRMEIIDSLAHEATISMQRDIMSGRRSEFMEQSVELLSLAQSLGLETPAHDICVPLLLVQENAARASRADARRDG